MAVVFTDGFEHVMVRTIDGAVAGDYRHGNTGHRGHSQFWLNDAMMETSAAFLLIQPCIAGSLMNRL